MNSTKERKKEKNRMAKRIKCKRKSCRLRLLTEAEREVILRDHDKKVKIWNPVIAGTVTLVLGLILLLVFLLGGVELMLLLLPLCLLGIAIIVYGLVSMMVVLHKVRTNKLRVAEAVYEGVAGSTHTVYLSGYRKDYGGYIGLRVAEKLKRGDKVIVIRVPGLVYKARKNR